MGNYTVDGIHFSIGVFQSDRMINMIVNFRKYPLPQELDSFNLLVSHSADSFS